MNVKIFKFLLEIIEPSQEYDATKDVNGDGYINVADIVELVNIMK